MCRFLNRSSLEGYLIPHPSSCNVILTKLPHKRLALKFHNRKKNKNAIIEIESTESAILSCNDHISKYLISFCVYEMKGHDSGFQQLA